MVTYFGSKHRSKSRAGDADAGRDGGVDKVTTKGTINVDATVSPGLMDRTKRFGTNAMMVGVTNVAMDAMFTVAREMGQKGAITPNANIDDLANGYARTVNQMEY